MRFDRRNTPRWFILIIDLLIIAFSVILAYLLRFNFEIPDWELKPLPLILGIIVVVRFAGFLVGKTYAGFLRFSSIQDFVRLIIVMVSGSIVFSIINIYTWVTKDIFLIPFSIIIIEFLTSTFGIAAVRVIVKITYLELTNPSSQRNNVIIFGAGEAGVLTKRVMERDAGSKLKVAAFIDDDPLKVGKKIEGIEIYKTASLESLLKEKKVEQVIISIQNLQPEKKQEIIGICLTQNVRVLNVPPIIKWINGELSFNQIRNINIEDLLEREVIKLDESRISSEITGKTILITGASGSIGSEIVRQVSFFNPRKIILLDQAESSLFHLELESLEKMPASNYEFILVDICNSMRMDKIFKHFKPDIVFHAAAYKHVPMMESNPFEAVYTNVRGTMIVADLSCTYDVGKFIMISTDKAVNPTNVMGASKRIAEIYTQALNQHNKTRFITTRFGNVLGSNGSVVPLFRQQIENGGPLTITHPKITRFFMTIREACQLVLEAGAMGEGGEIYIFDMGKSIKIADMARKMILLSGLELGKDIQIKFIGLRPGEKLYEELLNDAENTIPTHHPRILIARVRPYDLETIRTEIDELLKILDEQDNLAIVKKMKQIVPEFISKNSIYEQLDTASTVE